MSGTTLAPVVDLAVLVEAVEEKGGSQDTVSILQNQPEVKELAQHLHQILCRHGFCYLSNHGMPQSLLDRAFSATKQFFEQPETVKEKYARGVGDIHGWSGIGKEMLINNRSHGDMKESFNFTPYDEVTMPCEVPDMEPSFKELFHGCQRLVGYVLDLMAVAMELEDPGFMSRSHKLYGTKDSCSTLRCLRYPTDVQLKENQLSLGEHTDYGSMTVLIQDDVGGLQAMGEDGEYHNVPPVPGTVIIQMSDMIQRWTADKCRATSHRVLLPADAAAKAPARFSVAYFSVPDNDTIIQCLDGSDTYPPISALDYIKDRISRTSY